MRTTIAMLCVAALAACATNPATGVASNGHRLKIKYEDGTGSYVSNDVVSEDAIVDSNGNDTGMKVEHRQDVTHSYHWSQWGYYQGKDGLDEQDYYRIAGDQAAADEIARIRAGAETKVKIGLPLAIVGYVATAVVGGYGTSQQNTGIAYLGYYGGGAVALLGTWLAARGYITLGDKHLLPMQRADDSADLIQTCHEGRCSTSRGGRRPGLRPSELEQLRLPGPRGKLGMR
jgi:hypothetical protein